MQIQIFHSIILFTLTRFCASQDEQFRNCSRLFSCGEAIQSIGYPFWGGDRPRDCGLPGLELRCPPENHTTIDISRGQTFRVLNINFTSSNLMTIARSDLLDDLCPDRYGETWSNETALFRLTPDVRELYLFYDCPSSANGSVTCNINGASSLLGDVLVDDESSSNATRSCKWNVSVPVNREALNGLIQRNETEGIRRVLNQGFKVEYYYGRSVCAACERSGGLCWSETNSSGSCLCNDGIQHLVCPSTGKNLAKVVVTVMQPSIIGVIIASVIIGFLLKRRHSASGHHQEYNQDVEKFLYGSVTPKRYKYSEIKKVTKSFNEKLGQGGYGSVYKGTLPDGSLVAVKVLIETESNGEEFINEVASISKTSHVNIISLLGFCHEGSKRALVYEFMPNKSLDRFLSNSGSASNTACCLDLDKLYKITLGIAKGLEYLHTGCSTRIVHFDIKPQNILLDEDLCPKISDFGLAKLCKKKQSLLSVLGTRGTIGYIAPEIFSRNFGGVSHKSDVYSYGMMVLKMVGARNIVETEVIQSSENYFPDKIYEEVINGVAKKLDDFVIEEEEEITRKMSLVGFWCIQTIPSDRPSISEVVEMLEGSLQSIQIPPEPFLFSIKLLRQGISSTLSPYVEIENSAQD